MNLLRLLLLTIVACSAGVYARFINYGPYLQQPGLVYPAGGNAVVSGPGVEDVQMSTAENVQGFVNTPYMYPNAYLNSLGMGGGIYGGGYGGVSYGLVNSDEVVSSDQLTNTYRMNTPIPLMNTLGLGGIYGGGLGSASVGVLDTDELQEIVSADQITNTYRMNTPIPLMNSLGLRAGNFMGGPATVLSSGAYPSITYASERGVGGYEIVDHLLDSGVPYVERSFDTYTNEDDIDLSTIVLGDSVVDVDSMLANAQVINPQAITSFLPPLFAPGLGPAIPSGMGPVFPSGLGPVIPPSLGPVIPPVMGSSIYSMGIPPMLPPVLPRPPIYGGSSGNCGGCQQSCVPETIVQYQPVPAPYNVPYPVPSAPIVIEQEEPEIILTTTTTPAPVVTTTQVTVREVIMQPRQIEVESEEIVSGEETTVRVLEPAVSTTIFQPTTTAMPFYQPMPSCIPLDGQLGFVQNMLTQALGQTLPSQYQVLYASRAVGDQVNCRLALQEAANVCRSYNLMSPIGQNQWSLLGSSSIACPTTVPMSLEYCPIGAF